MAKKKTNTEHFNYTAFVETNDESVFFANKDLEIINVNKKGLSFLGLSKEEIIGMKADSFFSKAVLVEEPFRIDLLEGGAIVTRRRNLTTKKGVEIPVEMVTQKTPDGGYVSVIRGIPTKRNRTTSLEAEVESLRAELDKKNKLLAIQTITLSVKDELLKEIRTKFNESGQNPEQCKAQIISILENRIDMNNEWSKFNLSFQEIHPRFFKSIKELGVKLSPGELRLCAYLRMQMTTLEISEVLHLEKSSVNKKRNRIRKKLGITTSQNFNKFLQEL